MDRYKEYTRDDTREISIYALIDPRTFQVKYIGQTVNMERRLISHYYAGASIAMRGWMKELRALKIKPQIIELEKTIGFHALKMEHKWICIFREAGAPLINQRKAAPDYRAVTDWRWGDDREQFKTG